MVLHFYNTCFDSLNIFSLFSGGIIVSSTDFVFTTLLSYDLTTALVIVFPINLPVVLAAL